MSVCRNTRVKPGDRVTVEIQYSDRPVLGPLIGKLRTVEVTADGRAILYEEEGDRYQFNGRTVPAVALVEAAIFTDQTTGRWWADVYQLPPRESTPCPVPSSFAAVAERTPEGGIARLGSCVCDGACTCPGCGRQTVNVARGLEWAQLLTDGEPHSLVPGCVGPRCVRAEPGECPDCCAMSMMLAPIGWICRRDSGHRRPFRW